jgi:hypothetical protein
MDAKQGESMEHNDREAAQSFLRDLLMPGRGIGNASITLNVNAGGLAVWLCATACMVTVAIALVGGVVGGLWLTREFNRVDAVVNDLNDKDSVHDAYIQKLNNARIRVSEKKQ